MSLKFAWPNLDQRPVMEILAQAWDKSVSQTSIDLFNKYGDTSFYAARRELEELGYHFVEDGDLHVHGFVSTVEASTTIPEYPMQVGYNSNLTSTAHGKVNPALEFFKDETSGTITGNGLTKDGFKYFAGSAIQAIGAAGVGISLGKAFDSALYNLAPDFWDANGMKSLDPNTWNTITNGNNSFGAGLFNTIFGLNPTTGQGQLAIDENAYAYLAYWLKTQGAFGKTATPTAELYVNANIPNTAFIVTDAWSAMNSIAQYVSPSISTNPDGTPKTLSQYYTEAQQNYYINSDAIQMIRYDADYGMQIAYAMCDPSGNTSAALTNYAKINIADNITITGYDDANKRYNLGTAITFTGGGSYYIKYPRFHTGKGVWYLGYNGGGGKQTIIYARNNIDEIAQTTNRCALLATVVDGIEGMDNQEDATLPNVSDWNDVPSTLQSLQNQYPDLWNDAIPQRTVQPDGTETETKYIPIPMPQALNLTDTQPTTGTQLQDNTKVDLSTLPDEILNWITQFAVPTTTADPSPTGEGDTPTPIPSVGTASALWSVYHPTQAQVDAFGAWLWGSPFLTNIGKLFSNPIEGVISLHKIFVPPIDSGSGNIVVGTLDSGVSSATVDEQYVYVDCGTVDLYEQFGSVFDYPPFTEVSLYLPFIGIVPLDTNDVMRSTINVTYGVDIFTGACLAMVNVSRDNSTANMYQYAGCASVEYPLSNVQNGQLLAGILSAGAGIASIALTGGVSAPAVGAIVGGVASAAKSNVGKSGGFSGNAGAMGIKTPYLIIKRPQTKVADTFPYLEGYPTNYSTRLGDCSGHVIVKSVHVEGINATDNELSQIETLLKDGILI